MKIYLSGITSQIWYLWNNRWKYWLVAFPEAQNSKHINEILHFCDDLFLDSWWYSIRVRWLDLSVKDYVKFVNKYASYFTAITNMDTNDVKETLENQRILEQETWKTIIPVYHISDLLSWNIKLLDEYCEKYDYIWLWWVAWKRIKPKELMKYFSFIFHKAIQTKTKIHWFWITADSLIKMFPFYSVDSTSRLQWQKFNQFVQFRNGQRYKYSAWEYRQKFWLDPAKNPHSWKIWESKKQREKYNDYITKLHQVKWMEYRL